MIRNSPPGIDDPERLRRQIGTGPLLLATDFDGTLAEIVEQPEAATIRPDARRALEELAGDRDTTVAVVSGRALSDVSGRVGLSTIAYAGNHGLEIDAGDDRWTHPDAVQAREAVATACERVLETVGDVDGIRVEDKRLTATVHYREVHDADAIDRIRETVHEVAAEYPSLEVERAKQALELRPALDWDKGRAIGWLREELAADAVPAYLGDDTTDEDAMRAIGDDGPTVRVGNGETTADYRVPDPAAVASLLEWIATVRTETE